MGKDKKKKKNIKKIVKKAAKKIVKSKKQLTPDQQSSQIEIMKTILSRQPNPAMALDPQYRDLIQKNQQLNEMKNRNEEPKGILYKQYESNNRFKPRTY